MIDERNATGMIEVTQWICGMGLLAYDYKWTGNRLARVTRQYSEHAVRSGEAEEGPDWIRIGPYHLRIVDHLWEYDEYLVVKEGFLGDLYAFLYHLTIGYRRTRSRFIWSLNPWGLAGPHESRVPTWTDIYAVNWLAKKWHSYRQWHKALLGFAGKEGKA